MLLVWSLRQARPQQSERAPRAQDILRVWRGDRYLSASSAQQYLQWIGRFRRYCRALGLDEGTELGDAVLELILHPLHRARQLRLLRRALLGRVLVIGLGRDGAQGPAQAVVADELCSCPGCSGPRSAPTCA